MCTFPISYPMANWMPTKMLPELVFLFIFILFTLFTDFILDVVYVFALRCGITYICLAVTIMGWAANSVD